MIDIDQIQQLLRFDSGQTAVLSLYLDLGPERQVRSAYRIVFKDMVKEAENTMDRKTRKQVEPEIEQVQTWLDDYQPESRALALFSCQPKGFFLPFKLPVPVRDHLSIEPKPDVAQLIEIVDEHERYAVALVDKERARLFIVYMNQIEEEKRLEDFTPSKHDQGGVSQANFLRHHEAHVYRHLKKTVEKLSEVAHRRPFERLIIAGPEEAVVELRRLLPRRLADRVVATIPSELSASAAEILSQTLEVEQQIERAEEERLVKELVETAKSGGLAVAGLAPTFEALWASAVHLLVCADDGSLDGTECTNCHRLALSGVSRCPMCGQPMRTVHDLFERAAELCIEDEGRVELVRDAAARRLKDSAEGIGARLRFRYPPG